MKENFLVKMANPKVSVVMCTRNRLPILVRFCESLYAQSLLPNEFVIVDSSDKPASGFQLYNNQVVGTKPSSVKIKYYHTAPGLTFQRNFGVKHSTGDVIFFFDDDIVLESEFISEIMRVFESDPSYYGGVGTMTNYDNPTFVRKVKESFRGFWGVQRSYGDGKFYLSGFPKFPYGTNQFLDTDILGGGLTAYRREVFDYFSFDENVTGYSYMEDVDFSRRVTYQFRCFYQPLSRCDHRHAESGRGNIRENRKMLMVNFRYFYYKNIYKRNKWSILNHWFSIVGLFVLNIGIERWLGLIDGLMEFREKKKVLLG